MGHLVRARKGRELRSASLTYRRCEIYQCSDTLGMGVMLIDIHVPGASRHWKQGTRWLPKRGVHIGLP